MIWLLKLLALLISYSNGNRRMGWSSGEQTCHQHQG
jgi:hypothetical protein